MIAQWNVSQGCVSVWKRRPTIWFHKFLTFSHMISVFFQFNWLYLGQLVWKKTQFMWENVKNLQNHLIGRCFHRQTNPLRNISLCSEVAWQLFLKNICIFQVKKTLIEEAFFKLFTQFCCYMSAYFDNLWDFCFVLTLTSLGLCGLEAEFADAAPLFLALESRQEKTDM